MRLSSLLLICTAAVTTLLPSASSAQGSCAYDGSRIPLKEISSDFRFRQSFINILGSRMAYVDEGEGDPILFLRGQPTSSYLWRNIMLFMEGKGRIIAPDNIGFGNSAQPEIDYTFLDHYAYFEAFVEELELEDITLVTHDWGASLGLHYAARHPENVKGIVTMEALQAPILPAESFEETSEDLGNSLKWVRNSDNGRQFLNQDNAWLSAGGNLEGVIDQALAVKALRTCQAPFQTVQSRMQVNQWSNEFPILGDPAATAQIIDAYNKFLETTEIPWLLLYASPGATAPKAATDYWVGRARNIETVYIGHGRDYVEEDQPFVIGRAISVWYRRLEAE